MARSMTGYGRASSISEQYSVTVELKSVNHRFFEFNARVPRGYGYLEEKIKSYLQGKISRGKVDCYVSIDNISEDGCEVSINHALAAGYVRALSSLCEQYGVSNDISASALLQNREIFTVTRAPEDEQRVWEATEPVLRQALCSLINMRLSEGEKLKQDILSRCDSILAYVGEVERLSPETVKSYTARLTERMKAFLEGADVDEQRIATEAAIFADKVAVDEETVRLKSHIAQMHELVNEDEAVGRKMDFLVQEFNREANTIASKCTDVNVSKIVIEIKAEIEKIREQVQNIE